MAIAAVYLRDITERLSEFEEPWILAYFWLTVRKGGDRTILLEQLTKVQVPRPATWNPATVRREHEQRMATYGLVTGLEPGCFACGSRSRRLYAHHILEVQHGGSNDPKNIVPLCFPCHQYLHPWLENEPAPRQAPGFESLGSIAARTLGPRGETS